MDFLVSCILLLYEVLTSILDDQSLVVRADALTGQIVHHVVLCLSLLHSLNAGSIVVREDGSETTSRSGAANCDIGTESINGDSI